MNLITQVKRFFRPVPSKKLKNPPLHRPGYVDRHPGRTFLILGNGPSLIAYRDPLFAFIEKYNPVIMGANHITPYIYPYYHLFTNRARLMEFGRTIDPTKSKVLLGAYLPDWTIKSQYDGPYERLNYVNNLEARFDVQDGIIQTDCRSVVILGIGVAIIMGARRVFVAGLDGHLQNLAAGKQLNFYDQKFLPHENEDFFIAHQAICQRVLNEIAEYLHNRGRPAFKILTPTVYEDHFKGVQEFLE